MDLHDFSLFLSYIYIYIPSIHIHICIMFPAEGGAGIGRDPHCIARSFVEAAA